MTILLRHHRDLWSRRDFLSATTSGILLFLIGGIFLFVARIYLFRTYAATTAHGPDLLLDLLPVLRMENVLVWGVPGLIALMTFILVLFPERIPFCLKTIGLFLVIRSFFIILTPLGIRSDQVLQSSSGFFQNLAYGGNDFFFSGHVSFPFLFAMMFWQETWVRSMMLVLTVLFAVAVLLAHTHYSIDVFAAPFMVASIHRWSRVLFRDAEGFIALEPRASPTFFSQFFPSPIAGLDFFHH